MTKDILDKYIWLVDTIHQAGRITLAEINEKWHRSPICDGCDIPQRTFHNWKNAIQDTFDINIECDRRSGYRYYIEHPEDMTNGAMRTWLLDSLRERPLRAEVPDLHHRGHAEEPGDPAGTRKLLARRPFRLYRAAVVPEDIQPEMVCLRSLPRGFRTFALDRIQELTVLDTVFEYPKDFNPEEYFADFFGIITSSEISKETIRIKAYGLQVNYLRSLPLHHSQKETEKDPAGEWAVFEYRLRPATDLKHGNQLEVLSPIWLRESIARDIREMAARYK